MIRPLIPQRFVRGLPLILLLVVVCGSWGCTPSLHRFSYSEPKMGTDFRLVIYAPSRASADRAAEAAYLRIDELNATLSDYDAASEVMRLCRASTQLVPTPPIEVSDDLFRILALSQTWSKRSNGAFDVTVGPFVRLWRRSSRLHALPSDELLRRAALSVGYEHIRLNPQHQTVQLLAPDMRIDFGGIGKGYTVDEVLRLLTEHGIDRALVDGGGDIAVSGPPPGREGWRVAIPALPSDLTAGTMDVQLIELAHAAVATSGDLVRFVIIDGRRYSHIIDPATGLGMTDRRTVTIIAHDCTTADALASAVSVLGVARGFALIESIDHAAGRILTVDENAREQRVDASSRWRW